MSNRNLEFAVLVEDYWDQAITDATASKIVTDVFQELSKLYHSLDEGERRVAERVFAEGLSSTDPGKRWDARAIIRLERIRSALPALCARKDQLASMTDRASGDELRSIDSLIRSLESER